MLNEMAGSVVPVSLEVIQERDNLREVVSDHVKVLENLRLRLTPVLKPMVTGTCDDATKAEEITPLADNLRRIRWSAENGVQIVADILNRLQI